MFEDEECLGLIGSGFCEMELDEIWAVDQLAPGFRDAPETEEVFDWNSA